MSDSLRILALEPYYGGSHKQFLDTWASGSRHTFTILGLPPYKWKWRMRHSALTFVQQVIRIIAEQPDQEWDLLWCSDMLSLATFKALAPGAIGRLPAIAYFHENQLTYPVKYEQERDKHFAFTNFETALAADKVWFNSNYHRTAFLDALRDLINKMPDYQPLEEVASLSEKCAVHPPGIDPQLLKLPRKSPSPAEPMHLLWSSRWEYDKNPEHLFAALRILKAKEIPFRLSVTGESFTTVPKVFTQAKEFFDDHIEYWGFQEDIADYWKVLSSADIMISTARHEFFGIGVLEGVAAGAYPAVPDRLAYPEVLDLDANPAFFYGDNAQELAEHLESLAARHAKGTIWPEGDADKGRRLAQRYSWPELIKTMDLKAVECRESAVL